jgi:hypothetical protein
MRRAKMAHARICRSGPDCLGDVRPPDGRRFLAYRANQRGFQRNTGCDVGFGENFMKFDNLPAADTYVIEFTLDVLLSHFENEWVQVREEAHSRPHLPQPDDEPPSETAAERTM